MKIFIITVLFSSSAFACQFAPIECKQRTAHFDLLKVKNLLEKVERYQVLLVKHSHPKGVMHSCFNNNFAALHLEGVQKEINRYGKTCMEYRWKITSSVKNLISPTSLENRSVENEKVKEILTDLAKEIELDVKDI